LCVTKKIDYGTTMVSDKYAFWKFKRLFDLILSISLLPLLFVTTLTLVFLNIFYNKGPVFFIQKRMGKDCKPFYAIKFRTMRRSKKISRKYYDPIEIDRITTLGYALRKIRIDELPQILNVLKGDMSLIGPRPDYYEHALLFLKNIPQYRYRHAIRPGISGLSQIRLGYAEGLNATKKKSKVDIFYIENASFYLDVKIFFGTIVTILRGSGA
jgi:lipopolysaccharide/colanic/teichoic acid biosynthesis glycosyltransferase